MEHQAQDVLPLSWQRALRFLAKRVDQFDEVLIFLHAAKTGGSTFGKTLRNAPGWGTLILPPSYEPKNGCTCGATTSCHEKTLDAGFRRLKRYPQHGRLLIKLKHEPYWLAHRLKVELAALGFQGIRIEMTVRPAKSRIVSMFTDYWTQVSLAESLLVEGTPVTSHRAGVLRGYLKDSRYYSNSGTIDGNAFFRSFEKHGPGVPFFLAEIFETPSIFREALGNQHLTLVPTNTLDDHLTRIGGAPEIRRSRVSHPRPKAVTDALEQTKDLVAHLAARDEAFDDIVKSQFPEFLD